MLDFAQNDNELAGVLSHEYAHNIMDHIGAQKTNALIAGLFGAVIEGVIAAKGGNANGTFTRDMMNAGAQTYSADFEREADYVGVYIMEKAGYSSKALPNFWRRMSMKYPDAIYITTSHPSNGERAANIEAARKEYFNKSKDKESILPSFTGKKNLLGF